MEVAYDIIIGVVAGLITALILYLFKNAKIPKGNKDINSGFELEQETNKPKEVWQIVDERKKRVERDEKKVFTISVVLATLFAITPILYIEYSYPNNDVIWWKWSLIFLFFFFLFVGIFFTIVDEIFKFIRGDL